MTSKSFVFFSDYRFRKQIFLLISSVKSCTQGRLFVPSPPTATGHRKKLHDQTQNSDLLRLLELSSILLFTHAVCYLSNTGKM